MQLTTILAAVVLAGTAQAHIRLTALNGNTACVRLPPNNSPVVDVNSNNIVSPPLLFLVDSLAKNKELTKEQICNVNGATPAASVCSVAAGATVTTKWDTGAHPGPEIVYMAKVSDAKTTTITGLKWFKIYQSGLVGSGWASDTVNNNGGNLSFKIPSSIAAGQYLLRGETIGLHVASTYPGAQFYM